MARNRTGILIALLATTASLTPTAAWSQTGQDVVVMRRVLTPPAPRTPAPSPSSTPTPTSSPTPTQTPTPSPDPSPTPSVTPAQWNPGDWTYTGTDTCTDSAEQTRTVTCNGATGVVNEANCLASRPDTTRTIARTEGCTRDWTPIVYSPYDSACADVAHRTVTTDAICLRSDGKTESDESLCGTRPTPELTAAQYSGCTIDWVAGGFGSYSTTCGNGASRSQTVQCQRFGGTSTASILTADKCNAATKPPETEGPYAVITSCTYRWGTPTVWSDWTSECSTAATRTRTVSCMRSDNTTEADQAKCDAATKPSLLETGNFAGCTNSWQDGTYSAYDSTCSDAAHRTQITPITCVRSDGTPLTDDKCNLAEKPDPALTKAQYQGCTTDWVLTDPGTYSSYCSTTATRTTTYQCQRHGGNSATVTQPAASCTGANPSGTTGPYTVTSGCTYTPVFSTYGTCIATSGGATTGNQSAVLTDCTRSDGTSVSTSLCNAPSRSCTISYTPTFGAYGTCVRTAPGVTTGKRSKTITTCIRSSDNASVNVGYCTAPLEDCTAPLYTCDTPTPDYYVYGVSGSSVQVTSSINTTGMTKAARVDAAKAACEGTKTSRSDYNKLRACGSYDRTSSMDIYAYFAPNTTGTVTINYAGYTNSGFYASRCTDAP